MRPGSNRSSSCGHNKICELTILEMLIKSPTLDLSHHFFELGFRDRLVNEPFAARERAEIPNRCLEFGRYRQAPEWKIFRKLRLQRALGPIEGHEVSGQRMRRHIIRNPPQSMESVFDDRPHPELLRHVDLRRQQARGLYFPVQQSRETRAKAADIYWPDVLERKIFLKSVRNVEMTSGTHPDCDRDVPQVRGRCNLGVGPNKNPPRRNTVAIRHEFPHAGACVANAAPGARSLDDRAAF